jgi:hypothetical protein
LHNPLPVWARAADAAAVALLCLALFVAIEGGFVIRPAGIRISVNSEWRVILWACALVVARHFFVRDSPIHRRIGIFLGEAIRAAGPLREDVPDAGRAERIGPETPPRSGRSRRRRLIFYTAYSSAVIALYTGLAAAMTYPQVRDLGSAVSLDQGDVLFSTWRLAWVAHQLPRDPLHLFDGNIFYPEPGTLAFSDAMIVPALMGAPLLWLGVPPIAVHNILFLAAFALSGAAMFALVRSLTRHLGAALLAGFVFAFLPFRFVHYAHLELQITMWMPLCLWAFHRTIKRGDVASGLMTGLFFALQCLSSWYYGIFLATFLVPFGVAVLVAESSAIRRRSLRPLAAGGLLAAVLTMPMAVPYFAARASVGERPVSEIEFYSATPRNYLAAHHRNVMFGRSTSQWGGQERELFMGVVVPLIALVGLWPPLSAARIAYALGLVVAFDISLGFNGMLYPWLHAYVLPYRGLRVPARMAMIVGMSLSVLVGFGMARLARLTRSRQLAFAAFLILSGLVFTEYRSAPVLGYAKTTPPRIYERLPKDSASVLLELPLLQPDVAIEPIYMYFSTFHWQRLVNGYSGFSPPSYQVLLEKLARFPDEASIAELRRRGVTHVTVHGAFLRPTDYDTLVSRLDRSGNFRLIGVDQWDRRETRLYELLPPDVNAHR